MRWTTIRLPFFYVHILRAELHWMRLLRPITILKPLGIAVRMRGVFVAVGFSR